MPAIEIGALIVAALAAGGAAYESKQANQDQKKAAKADNRRQLEENKRAARQTSREQRIRSAAIAQGAANTGTADSSGAVGAMGSTRSQAASSIGFQGYQQGISNAIYQQNKSAAGHLQRSDFASTVNNLAMSVYGQTGGIGPQPPKPKPLPRLVGGQPHPPYLGG